MQSHTPHPPTPNTTPPHQGEGGAGHPPRAATQPCKGVSRVLYTSTTCGRWDRDLKVLTQVWARGSAA